jgi:hypothetical protein
MTFSKVGKTGVGQKVPYFIVEVGNRQVFANGSKEIGFTVGSKVNGNLPLGPFSTKDWLVGFKRANKTDYFGSWQLTH